MRDRLSDETVEEREARLQQMRIAQQERRSTETATEMEARLQQDRESHRAQRALGVVTQSQLPLLHQHSVQAKMKKFANSLPRLPSELDVIVVRKEEATQSHRDFRVRRSIVLHALQWLLANNIYYRNIRIDPDALAVLPEDGDLTQ